MPDQPFVLRFTDKGEGQNLLLLHGFLESHTMWEYLHLHDNFRTIAIDLPGHGDSKELPEANSIAFIAACVKHTLDSLHLENYSIIGHSLGGYVASEFLYQFGCPGRFILLNSNFWQDDESKQADRLRVANLALKNKNLFIREAIPGLFSKTQECQSEITALIAEAKEISGHHIASTSIAMRNRLNHKKTIIKWAKKISILQGELDKICPPERMEIEVEGVAVDVVSIPEAGHMSHIENTSFVRKSIIGILTRNS